MDVVKASDSSFARCETGGTCKIKSSAELLFEGGARIEWETSYRNSFGKADVYLDGRAYEAVDLCKLNSKSSRPKFGIRTYILSGDATTPHSIKIVATGHSGCSTGARARLCAA